LLKASGIVGGAAQGVATLVKSSRARGVA
jgi:hypothetical protein